MKMKFSVLWNSNMSMSNDNRDTKPGHQCLMLVKSWYDFHFFFPIDFLCFKGIMGFISRNRSLWHLSHQLLWAGQAFSFYLNFLWVWHDGFETGFLQTGLRLMLCNIMLFFLHLNWISWVLRNFVCVVSLLFSTNRTHPGSTKITCFFHCWLIRSTFK